MSYSVTTAQQFEQLFQSNKRAYGLTRVGEIVEGKAQSESQLIHEALTTVVFERHLAGQASIGASPLLDDSTVKWCAIDIDDYPYDLMNIVEAIEDFNIPLVPCFSKSKKLHIYCFFTEPVPAADARDLLKEYLIAFRCSPKTEIFPKQERASSSNKFYSWINLPYFDCDSDNWRKSVKGRNQLRTVEEFIDVATERCRGYAEHKKLLEMTPFYGAPPCIRSGAMLRDIAPGTRNQWFYNVACYLRMTDEDIDLEEPLLALNDTMRQPLPVKELQNTVCKINSTSYWYQCSGISGCDKASCKKSRYGVGNGTDTTGFSYGQLTKINGDPVYWRWEINKKELVFHSTEEIMQQNSFRKQCMEKLNLLPHRVKEERWTAILRRALDSVVEEAVEIRGDFGSGAQFMSAMAAFFAGSRSRASDITQVYTGKVYLDETCKEYVFTAKSLQEFIIDKQRVPVTAGDIRDRVLLLGGKRDGDLWRIAVADAPKSDKKDIKIDYHNAEGYDDAEYQF